MTSINIIPFDGTATYYPLAIDRSKADNYFQYLSDHIPWHHDEVYLFGKKIITKRQVAWYGDEGCCYTYSGAVKNPIPWIPVLLELKTIAEHYCPEFFNSCLLNYYHDGNEGMGWHSDNEKELKENGCIASLSFGANRKFVFKHNSSKEKVEIVLEHGSLLVMGDDLQTHWKHALPKSKKILYPRINLTFRNICH